MIKTHFLSCISTPKFKWNELGYRTSFGSYRCCRNYFKSFKLGRYLEFINPTIIKLIYGKQFESYKDPHRNYGLRTTIKICPKAKHFLIRFLTNWHFGLKSSKYEASGVSIALQQIFISIIFLFLTSLCVCVFIICTRTSVYVYITNYLILFQ